MDLKKFESKQKSFFVDILILCILLLASCITFIFISGTIKTIFLAIIIVLAILTMVVLVLQILLHSKMTQQENSKKD